MAYVVIYLAPETPESDYPEIVEELQEQIANVTMTFPDERFPYPIVVKDGNGQTWTEDGKL